MSQTISAILDSQTSLVQAAAEALPHQFSQCTHALGHIRQAVYLCLTCAVPRGICAACSIACHTDHEQLELFPKRAFRCDCPTAALAHPCALHRTPEPENTRNAYGQNFRGAFCRCGRAYDAARERETMIQCLTCEDWFHESCLSLRERPLSRASTPEAGVPAQEVDDAASEASSNDLPPPLIRADNYDALICAACVRSIPVVRRYAGTPGALMVVRDVPGGAWSVIGREAESGANVEVETVEARKGLDTGVGEKRARSPTKGESDAPNAKRARVSPEASSSPACLAPPVNSLAQQIFDKSLSKMDGAATSSGEEDVCGEGDVFLTEGFRDRWCQCSSCLLSFETYPCLLEEEETYEPPEDPDSGLSLEELGMRALLRLPRERALDGIRAFNQMRDELMSHLRPFAQEGKEVTESDIRAFFEERMAAARGGVGESS
ncbi:predicted protein [Postia placenta Mad-698-R]|nr:predicted protein [Postia placenta Mad-698-R]